MNLQARIAVLEDEIRVKDDRIRLLEDALGLTMEFPLVLGMTPMEGRILAMLHKFPDGCLKTKLHYALYCDRFQVGDDPAPKIVEVVVCKMRKKLKAFEIEIETLWGHGYRLGAGSHERIDALQQETKT